VLPSKVMNHIDPPDGIKDQLINASIIAGFNFFSTLASTGVTQLTTDPLQAILAGTISAGIGFFGSLMVQRGISKYNVIHEKRKCK